MDDRPKYNVQRHNKATMGVSLRAVVALYLAYLGWKVIRSRGEGTSLAPWMSIAIGLLFIAVAVAFGAYTYRCYQRDLKAAEVHDDEQALPEEKEPGQEP